MSLEPPSNLAEIRAAYAALRALLPPGTVLALNFIGDDSDADPWIVLDYVARPGDGGDKLQTASDVAVGSIGTMFAILARLGIMLELPNIPVDYNLPVDDLRRFWVSYQGGTPGSFVEVRQALTPALASWIRTVLDLIVEQTGRGA